MPTLFPPCSRARRAMILALALVTLGRAQSSLPPSPLSLETLEAFAAPAANWQLAGGIAGDPRTETTLVPLPGHGILVNNPTTPGHRGHLITAEPHGDVEVDVEFLLPAGSNSGVYLMSRYEVQLLDSWGVKVPTSGDCGGIYHRWDDARGAGHEGFEGSAPRANACRAPGLWQKLHIVFQAPRFDAAGRKTANARFVQVVLNDFVVQENVELTGPTRSGLEGPEVASAPLLIQGDHGSVAIRRLAIKRFDRNATPVAVSDLTYKLYSIDPQATARYDAVPPTSEGRAATFAAEAVEKNGRYVLEFAGQMKIPRDGEYLFTTGGYESVGLTIAGQPAIQAHDRGGQSVPVNLRAGSHPFQVIYQHRFNGRPRFSLSAEGPGLAPHPLTAAPENRAARENREATLLIQPTDGRIRMQRGFVPYDPQKRLYATSVGIPGGLNYAYDFETGAILRVWRGDFLDTSEMWDGRGENQFAKPAGPALTLNDRPVLALLERYAYDWPNTPDALWGSQGYQLEPNGQPTFAFKLASLSATDRIAPSADGHGLTRTLTVTGQPVYWSAWVLLAEADVISAQPGGRGYVIGDRSYYLDLPSNAPAQPLLRTRNGRQQLVLPIDSSTLGQPLTSTLVW